MTNYPDNVSMYLMDRSQASKRLRYSEVEELKLIDEIISNANLDDEQEERMLRRLERKDTDELNDLLVLSRSQRPGMTRQPTYLGAAGGIATNLGRSDSDDDDVLPLPVIDWSAEAKAKKA